MNVGDAYELIVQSDKLTPAELQSRMLADDDAWKRGRFRKARPRQPLLEPMGWRAPYKFYTA